MIGLLLKKLVSGSAPQTETPRATEPAPDCAIWNDIARALDAKPKSVLSRSATK
jgi:hypothetical protein